jgi:hypothetical protein
MKTPTIKDLKAVSTCLSNDPQGFVTIVVDDSLTREIIHSETLPTRDFYRGLEYYKSLLRSRGLVETLVD